MTRDQIVSEWKPRSPAERTAQDEKHAAACARKWKADCHVYVLRGVDKGVTVFSNGPDPDRPRTAATFISEYRTKA